MACKIAENEPLKWLRSELRLPMICHSLRTDCIHNLFKPSGNFTLGIPGAALGYCQALFVKTSDPESNTENIISQLASIDAPWHKSHELYWGNKSSESIDEFITSSVQPLLGTGRMPILITPLNPNFDYITIRQILNTDPLVFEGETTLVRIVLTNEDSVNAAVSLMKEVLDTARRKGIMPKFWLLLQGQLSASEWHRFADLMGHDWQFVNIAVNPFTMADLPEICWNQVTVAQVVLGHLEGIDENGNIKLPDGMKIAGANNEDSYNLYNFIDSIKYLEVSPTLIILGPSFPYWSDEYNLARIQKFLPLLRKACERLWRGLSKDRRNMVLSLSA